MTEPTKSNENQILRNRLKAFFGNEQFNLHQIQGGASARSYYLIDFDGPHYFPKDRILLMSVPQQAQTLLSDFMNIDYYLKRSTVNTPRLFEMVKPEGWAFVDYIPTPTMEQYLRKNLDQIPSVLSRAVDFLIELQRKCHFEVHCPAFQRRFDFEKYEFEFNFHLNEQLLNFYLKVEPDAGMMAAFKKELCGTLDIEETIFVHRDLQSSNVFFEENGNGGLFHLIDFQDARYGTPLYDLASLLWDSYLPISDDVRQPLIERHYASLKDIGIEWDRDYYDKILDYSVIQRKLHDAGAFAYNYRRFLSNRYVGYIGEAVDMSLKKMRKYPALQAAAEFLENTNTSRPAD